MNNIKLTKFYTTWCGPCKHMTILLKEVDMTGVEFVEIDAEKEPEIAKKYGIQSVPVLIFEKDGEVVNRINGLSSPEVIQGVLDDVISGDCGCK